MKESSLTPPDWIFKVVWPILYMMMAISLIIFYNRYPNNFWVSLGFIFFIIQLILNLYWPVLFFQSHKLCASFFLILMLIVFVMLTMKEFFKYSFTAGMLLLPYLLWIIFASYLNLFICISN